MQSIWEGKKCPAHHVARKKNFLLTRNRIALSNDTVFNKVVYLGYLSIDLTTLKLIKTIQIKEINKNSAFHGSCVQNLLKIKILLLFSKRQLKLKLTRKQPYQHIVNKVEWLGNSSKFFVVCYCSGFFLALTLHKTQ